MGYCALTWERRRTEVRCVSLQGLPLWAVEAATGRWERQRLDRGARRLARKQVRRVLTPEGFPHWDVLAARGLIPPDGGPLLRRLAPGLALARLERSGQRPERATVALCGTGAAQLHAAAEALCPRVGGLLLCAPDGEKLSRWLRSNYGLAVLEDRGDGLADLTLRFAPEARKRQGPTLELWPGAPPIPGLRLSLPGAPPPEICGREQWLAVLWETGRLDPGRVQIDFA